MKKKLFFHDLGCYLWLKVCLPLAILCATALNSTAVAGVQDTRFTFKLTEVPLEQVFRKIESVSSYKCLYSNEDVRNVGKVSVDVKDATVDEVMTLCLKGSKLEYKIVDQTIIVSAASQGQVKPGSKVTVKGRLTTADGAPIPFAAVLIKGTTTGVQSDMDGRYSIQLTDEPWTVLVYSYLGMKTVEEPLSRRQEVNVVLQPEFQDLEEVVVVGYSTKKVSEMTGAAQQFKGQVVTNSIAATDIIGALKGHTTGLQITGSTANPAIGASMLVRGNGTLHGSESPLVVIDGVVVGFSILSDAVSPNDIETITLLKDAASTAIYGSRAASGVLVVTTKKGRQEKMSVNMNVKYGISAQPFNGFEYMNTQELLEWGKMSLGNWWDTNDALHGTFDSKNEFITDKLSSLYENFDLTKSTNWRKHQYRTGSTVDANLSISGGSEKMTYYASYTYFDDEPTKPGDRYKRNQIRGKFDFRVKPYLTIGANISGTFTDVKTVSLNVESMHPWLSPYNADGSYKYSMPVWSNLQMQSTHKENQLADMRYNNNLRESKNLLGTFFVRLQPFTWMTLTTTNTFTSSTLESNSYQDKRTYAGNNSNNNFSNGTLQLNHDKGTSFLTSNLLNLQRDFGDHHLSGLLGQEFSKSHSIGDNVNYYEQTVIGERNAGGFAKIGNKAWGDMSPSGSESENGLFSVFAEANYNYKGKYMASASFRRDASVNFGKDNRYGSFYSVSASWLATSEKFMQNQKVFSNLKLRASFGTSGREAGQPNLNYTLYWNDWSFNYYQNNPYYQAPIASTIGQLGNDQLTWETSYNTNIGLDMGFLKNRIALSADIYNRLSTDLIINVNRPAAGGVGTQYRNIGEIRNRGIELVLNTHNVKTADFNWYTDFTFSYNQNKLMKLDNGSFSLGWGPTYHVGDNYNKLEKVKVAGIEELTGTPLYERVNEDGSIELVNSYSLATAGNGELSNQYIGLDRAPYFGGFSNTFTYKGFSLFVNMNYSFGHMVNNNLKMNMASGRNWMSGNVYKVPKKLKVWQKPGDRADIPRINADPSLNQNLSMNTSYFYQKGDYARLQTVRLSYTFAPSLLSKIGLQRAELSFSVDNVAFIASKKFVGLDPENPGAGGAPRRYMFGLNVGF